MKGTIRAISFVKAYSMLENHKQHDHCHRQNLDDEQKSGLLMEKDSFNNFWEHEENHLIMKLN